MLTKEDRQKLHRLDDDNDMARMVCHLDREVTYLRNALAANLRSMSERLAREADDMLAGRRPNSLGIIQGNSITDIDAIAAKLCALEDVLDKAKGSL